jgi:hypothetical protein
LVSVAEDRPPHEPAWIEPHPDPNDAWLWNAARRAGADFVITQDLRDAPPVNSAGSRLHDRVHYIHPTDFMPLLDLWADLWATADIPADVGTWVRDAMGRVEAPDITSVAASLESVLARMADEAPAEGDEVGPGA